MLARVYAAHLGDGINGILRIFREQLGSMIYTQLIDIFREAASGLFLEICAEKRGGDVQFLLQGLRRDTRLQVKLTDRYLMQCMFQKFLFIDCNSTFRHSGCFCIHNRRGGIVIMDMFQFSKSLRHCFDLRLICKAFLLLLQKFVLTCNALLHRTYQRHIATAHPAVVVHYHSQSDYNCRYKYNQQVLLSLFFLYLPVFLAALVNNGQFLGVVLLLTLEKGIFQCDNLAAHVDGFLVPLQPGERFHFINKQFVGIVFTLRVPFLLINPLGGLDVMQCLLVVSHP